MQIGPPLVYPGMFVNKVAHSSFYYRRHHLAVTALFVLGFLFLIYDAILFAVETLGKK